MVAECVHVVLSVILVFYAVTFAAAMRGGILADCFCPECGETTNWSAHVAADFAGDTFRVNPAKFINCINCDVRMETFEYGELWCYADPNVVQDGDRFIRAIDVLPMRSMGTGSHKHDEASRSVVIRRSGSSKRLSKRRRVV